MARYFYEDFIWKHLDALDNEGARLSDLSDEDKDHATYIWMMSHKTWFEDIYPVSIGRSVAKIITEMLFGKRKASSELVSNMFIALAEDMPREYGRDEQWWSEALGKHLDNEVNLGNFADSLRDDIYLYLEEAMEDEIFNQLSSLKAREKYEHYEE